MTDRVIFVLDPAESVGARVARIATEALAAGPMGNHIRGDYYEAFLDTIWDRGGLLRSVHTSCGIFAGAVLGYAGHKLRKPWRADGSFGIVTWLNLSFSHPAWIEASDAKKQGLEPEAGDPLYWGSKTGSNGHTGITLERLPNGLWRSAEGGGSPTSAEIAGMTAEAIKSTNGTLCRMTGPAGKDIHVSAGRPLAGWWRVDLLGLPTGADVLNGIFPGSKTDG